MATNATIKIEGYDLCKVFKYWDGNPENTLPWLEDFNQKFVKQGRAGEYKMASLLRSSAFDAKEFNLDDSPYSGWGVVNYNHEIGVPYEYTLHLDGSVSYEKLA